MLGTLPCTRLDTAIPHTKLGTMLCTFSVVFFMLIHNLQVLVAQNHTCNVYNDNGGNVNITDTQRTINKVEVYTYHELYCHADNFCQIDWYRDGIPRDGFPHLWNFTSDVQEGHIELKDNNQTLYFYQVRCDAQGSWMCVVSRERSKVNHTMEIIVTDNPYTLAPIIEAHDLCLDVNTTLGKEVTLFCPVSAKDVTSEVILEWFKWKEDGGIKGNVQWVPVSELGANGTIYTLSQPQKDIYSRCDREDDKNLQSTIGQYLTINKVTEMEYGRYRLVATRMDDSKYKGKEDSLILHVEKYIPPKPMIDSTTAIALGMAALFVFLSTSIATVIWHHKGLDIRLFIKDKWKKESTDGKKYDAYIAYSESDSDLNFVLETLMPTLQKEGYVVFVKDIDAIPGETLVEQLISGLKESRRCILVISPDFLRARHTSLQLEVATDQMLQHKSKIIPLIFKSVKKEDPSTVRGLKRILSVLHCITWNDMKEDKTKKQLLLKMPPVIEGRLELPLSSQYFRGNQSENSSQQSLVQENNPYAGVNNDMLPVGHH